MRNTLINLEASKEIRDQQALAALPKMVGSLRDGDIFEDNEGSYCAFQIIANWYKLWLEQFGYKKGSDEAQNLWYTSLNLLNDLLMELIMLLLTYIQKDKRFKYGLEKRLKVVKISLEGVGIRSW